MEQKGDMNELQTADGLENSALLLLFGLLDHEYTRY